ncbi:hypothetical protein C8Q75DRAFT_330420 [Abortiporus biennis]|nr:hypothetical protein C8Q75DRAFT_330420 [Abortiporus biennis]
MGFFSVFMRGVLVWMGDAGICWTNFMTFSTPPSRIMFLHVCLCVESSCCRCLSSACFDTAFYRYPTSNVWQQTPVISSLISPNPSSLLSSSLQIFILTRIHLHILFVLSPLLCIVVLDTIFFCWA